MPGVILHFYVYIQAFSIGLDVRVVCPARYDRRDIMFPGCLSLCPFLSVRLSHFGGYHFACSAKQTICLFNRLSLCMFWPPYSLFPRSCLTTIFCVDPHWWVPLSFQQTIMHALKFCKHDVNVWGWGVGGGGGREGGGIGYCNNYLWYLLVSVGFTVNKRYI